MPFEPYSCAMYLRKLKKANGRIYLSIVQSYRTVEGKPRSKTLWSLGYVDELERDHPDPIAYYQQVIDELNSANEEQKRSDTSVSITFADHAKIPFATPEPIEIGAIVVLAVLYRDLELKRVSENCITAIPHENRQKQTAELPAAKALARVVELLTWNRMTHLLPIEDAWASRSSLPGMKELAQNDLFASMNALGIGHSACLETANASLQAKGISAKNGWAYCFVFNHYVEGARYSNPDYSTNWQVRTNPIVQVAVMTDVSGVPLDYSVFDSTLAAPLSLFPAIRDLSQRHADVRLIIVSDKAIGSSNYELGVLSDKGYGFVLLQSMRKGKRSSRDWVLDTAGYTPFGTDGSRYKQRMGIRTIEPSNKYAHASSIAIKEVALWLREAFESTRFNRFREIRRNESIFSNGAPSEGALRPLRARYGSGDAKLGAIDDRVWHVYWDKIAADEAMDGYLDIITSELDLATLDVIGLYRSFNTIRSFFMPLPGEWSTTPISLSRHDYVQAHYLICYLAACTSQLLYNRSGRLFPSESIRTTLARLTGIEVNAGRYYFDYRTPLSDHLAETSGIDLSCPLLSASQIARMVKAARR